MSEAGPVVGRVDDLPTSRSLCPRWCVTGHRADLGEEDWLHSSEPVRLVDGLAALLVMSIDPSTGEADGPYVLLRDTELTLAEVSTLATSLSELVTMAAFPPPSHPGTRAGAASHAEAVWQRSPPGQSRSRA